MRSAAFCLLERRSADKADLAAGVANDRIQNAAPARKRPDGQAMTHNFTMTMASCAC
jgi:hypothetical protein